MSRTNSILVTGGAGYIGSHTVLALMDRGLGPVSTDAEGRSGQVGPATNLIKF